LEVDPATVFSVGSLAIILVRLQSHLLSKKVHKVVKEGGAVGIGSVSQGVWEWNACLREDFGVWVPGNPRTRTYGWCQHHGKHQQAGLPQFEERQTEENMYRTT
jgi:hypothetical protein